MRAGIRRVVVAVVGMVVVGSVAVARGEVEGLGYPHVGVSLVGPRGWEGRFVGGKYQVARWDRVEGEGREVRAVVEVRAVPGKGRTLEEMAEGVRKEMGGKVAERGMKVDGVEGCGVEGDWEVPGLRVRGMIVMAREGVMYQIVGAAVPGVSWHEGAAEVIERWKWIPLEGPALRMRDVPDIRAVFLKGLVRMPIPVGMGVSDAQGNWFENEREVELALCNFRKVIDEFVMKVEVRERGAGETFDQMRAKLAEEMKGRAEGEVVWRYDPDIFSHMATEWVKVKGRAEWEQVAVAEADERKMVVVRFRVVGAGAEEREAYVKRARYMFGDMAVARGKKEGE